MYEHRNLGAKGQQVSASCNAPNLVAPGDDLGFRVDYKQPYVFGSIDPKRTAVLATAFNARKISGVFIAGASLPPLRQPPTRRLSRHLHPTAHGVGSFHCSLEP